MKRIISISLILIISIISLTVIATPMEYTALYIGSNKAYVNDVEQQIDVENPEVKVFAENNRTYVPVRFISESYEGEVEWVQETQTVNIVFPDRTISLTLGIPEIVVDGEQKALDVAPVAVAGRTYLPLRASVEAIGKEVFYSKGLILISDIPDILDEKWDEDVVDLLIEEYFK